jgi:hypothetical protein
MPGASFFSEEGTKIIGGTLNTVSNGDIVVKNALLDGGGTHAITNDGNLEVQIPSATKGLFTQGVIINHSLIAVDAGTKLFLGLPSSPGMDTTLKGGGLLGLSNATIDLSSTTTLSKPLTLNNVDNTISGYGNFGSNATGASLMFNNGPSGVVNADANNQALSIYSNVINSHLMEATGGGALAFFGFTNVVANATGTIKADTNSSVFLQGTIKGGRLEGAGIVDLGGGATLDGSTTPLTNAGNVDFSVESFATLKGTIINNGNIEVGFPSPSAASARTRVNLIITERNLDQHRGTWVDSGFTEYKPRNGDLSCLR